MLRKVSLQLLVMVGCAAISQAEPRGSAVSSRPVGRRLGVCEDQPLPDPGPPPVAGRECLWRGGERPDYLSEIRCVSDFEVLSASLPSAVFAGTRTLHFVVDMEDGDRLYFFNAYAFDLHYTFAKERLDGRGWTRVGSHWEFNRREYESMERRFLLGNVVHYGDQDVFTLELAAGDIATAAQIARAFRRVRAGLRWPARTLAYRPVSEDQLDRPARLPRDIPVLDTGALQEGVRFQPVRPGRAVGRLVRVTTRDLDDASIGPRDILLTDRVPLDLPPVAGIVTGELQTPLAHVAMLAHARGIPDMALVGAFEREDLGRLVGEWVELEVTRQGWTIERTDARAVREPTRHVDIPLDLGPRDLLALDAVDVDDIGSVGAKAAHLGAAAAIGLDVPVPEGFVVPVSHFVEHMRSAGLDVRVAEIASDAVFRSDRAALAAALDKLRDDVRKAPLPPALVDAIRREVRRVAGDAPVRFRSSTNAEDLAGFSGAGLYTSTTVDLSDPRKSIERGLRKVWGSVFNLRAWEEREIFGIPHTRVAMAVLVHRSFPDEAANGVAVTRNLFTSWRPAFTVNVQAGEASVTNPDGRHTPEQFLYYTYYNEGPRVEYLARSSVTGGTPVLSPEEMDRIARALAAIHERFARWYGDTPGYSMDVEFKLDGPDRALTIKQARPFVSEGC